MEALPSEPTAKSPGELYMAFGPQDRVVRAAAPEAGVERLAHFHKGDDGLWRLHCPPQDHAADDPEGDFLYQALRRLVDGCPVLTELEP